MDLQQYKAEDFILNDSFVRYCLRSNDTDVQFWEDWLERYPHKQEEAAKAREWLFRLGLRITPEEKETEFGKLKAALAAADTPVKKISWKRMARIAAAAILPLAAAAWWLNSHRSVAPAVVNESYTLFKAGDTARRQVMLADGSLVILNAHSTLKVPASYNEKQRNLVLEGEALFEVAKAEGKPFVVSTGNLHVQALGTAFKLRAYRYDQHTAVTLVEGKVRVAQEAAVAELIPGEQLTTGKTHARFVKNNFDAEREKAWRSGRLVFHNASPDEIASTLGYWYGINVKVITRKNKPIRFNGVFNNKSLNEVLAAVCFVNGLESVTKNDTLFVQPISK
ncbi:ferric-dicitrate binding protein FerR, regulates iron transport through sigma-19 [Chitinophaga eiseniae]|uniref:Ferric-dicitrate binding protein FerR, regulates iron transport through sigma-19 n=1 Tax=Chitinophaga eiseniae TaxID=634771 RepID=A0A1T4NMT0_9BACT|nr:FecR family protein [Chitinophaga eiseniae]SJZ80512.1 ferric-dicitrate binding protein FerR, regulates iron transport through sigma-19 [Chitinophaga eiseniae]